MSGFTVTHNLFAKRAAWSKGSGQCKGFWEIKDGSNILFEGNTVEGPIDSVTGQACPINTTFATNQYGDNPWAATNNNIFRSNLFNGVNSVFPGQPYNNLCPVAEAPSGGGFQLTNNLFGAQSSTRLQALANALNGRDWLINHNTWVVIRPGGQSTIIMNNASIGPTTGVTFRDNVVWSGGDGTGNGGYFKPFSQFPGFVTNHNLYRDQRGGVSPCPADCNGMKPDASDKFVYSDVAVGMVNLADCLAVDGFNSGGNYHSCALSNTSPGHRAASDGTDIGVNFDQLDAALGITSQPAPTPSVRAGERRQH